MPVRRLIAWPDHQVMRRLHRWRAPNWVRWWMVGSTRLGDGWLWLAAILLVLWLGGSERSFALRAAGLSAGVSALVFLLIKRVTGRTRPCHLEPHCWAKLLPPDQFSFPSGHTMMAFALATPLGLSYPAVLWLLLFCALSIGASRVVLGMHFLSDVLAGAALGTWIGYSAYAHYLPVSFVPD